MLAERMQAVFSRQIRCVCFLGGVKQPKANSLVIQFNLSFPTVVFAAYSGITRFVVAPFLILRVLGISGFSQVTQSVVGAIFVSVMVLGEFATSGALSGRKVNLLGNIIVTQVGSLKWAMASVTGVILTVVMGMVIAAFLRIVDLKREL